MLPNRLKPASENHNLHVKPHGDSEYIEAINILKYKGFSLSSLTRELLKEYASKIKRIEL